MKHLLGLILCSFAALASSAPQKKPTPTKKPLFPFPIKNVQPGLYEDATPYFKFDGIDFDELPKKLKDNHYNCYGELLRCIRNRNYFHTICSFAVWYNYGNYYSYCQLELLNCESRVNSGYGVYGNFYSNDQAFFQGEGWNCMYSQNEKETRRLANPDPGAIVTI